MSRYIAEEFKENGYTVRIVHDDDAESPREWDNLGIMFAAHGRYTLGDADVSEFQRAADHFYEQATSKAAFNRMFTLWLKVYHGATVVLPLGLYDHSGLSMYVGSEAIDLGGWDSGQVGWIFDTAASRDESGVNPAHVEQVLRSEVKVYDQYLTGDVYGYEVLDTEGDVVESCYGFFGVESATAQGTDAARYLEPTTVLDGLRKRRIELADQIARLDEEIRSLEG